VNETTFSLSMQNLDMCIKSLGVYLSVLSIEKYILKGLGKVFLTRMYLFRAKRCSNKHYIEQDQRDNIQHKLGSSPQRSE